MANNQLNFNLQPQNHYAGFYFVLHSGIIGAFERLKASVETFEGNQKAFFLIYIYGRKGLGKTHLIHYWREKFEALSFGEDAYCVFDFTVSVEEQVPEFVSTYERCKREGGILVVEAESAAERLSCNPHLQSRIVSSDMCEVFFPKEEELKPLLYSLLERKNLRLSESSIEYLLKRIPIDLLSFDSLIAKISELSLSQGRPAKLGVIREALETITN